MFSIPLFLSDVAGSEVMVIVLVVLLFFGSKSVPGIAKSLGQALYQIRNASNELQQEIRKSGEDMKKDLRKAHFNFGTDQPNYETSNQ